MKTTSHVARAGLTALMVALSGALLLATCSYIPVFGKAIHAQKVLKGKVERDIALAEELMQKGRFSDAADVYWQALNRNTKSVPATLGLGMAQVKQFKLDAADEQFDKALALDSTNPLAHSGKALVTLNRLQSSSQSVISQRDSMLKQAESECNRALELDANSPEARNTLGLVYKEQGRLDDALAQFNEAAKIDPQYSDAYAGIGTVRMAQGRLPEAVENFKHAIALNSSNSTAHFGLGKAYKKQGFTDKAIKELNISLYQFPNSWPVRFALGEAYQDQGNIVAAVREYQESIRIKPENPEPYLRIADIREARGDIEHSVAELRSGLTLMPTNSDLRLRVGDSLLRLEKLDDAIKEYTAVMDQNPQSTAAAQGLTRAYYLKAQKEATSAFVGSNDFERAEATIAEAVRMNPDDLELRLAQAKMRALSGTPVDLSTIGTPTTDGERISYAEALLAQNKFPEAAAQMNTVIANAKGTKQTLAVGDLALMIRDLDSAESAYKKASTMPGGQERSKRGLALVAKARSTVRQDINLANDLSRKQQLASAVDKYHEAIFADPRKAEPRLGIAQTLQKIPHASPSELREAATQYRVYTTLSPNLPIKERDKFMKTAVSLESKAFKLEKRTQQAASTK